MPNDDESGDSRRRHACGKQPPTSGDRGLLDLLHGERLVIEQEIAALRIRQRDAQARIERAERRLRQIDYAEGLLQSPPTQTTGPRAPLDRLSQSPLGSARLAGAGSREMDRRATVPPLSGSAGLPSHGSINSRDSQQAGE
jgi:hypothetical protein